MGLAIDEDIAIIIRGPLGEVVGRGSVPSSTAAASASTTLTSALNGGALTLSYLRVGIVGVGSASASWRPSSKPAPRTPPPRCCGGTGRRVERHHPV